MMRNSARISLCMLVLVLCAGCLHTNTLLVTPYREGNARTTCAAETIARTMKGQGFSSSLEVFDMDTKGRRSDIWRTVRGHLAVARVNAGDPEVIFVFGDEAAQYFARRLADTPRKFVFFGVKADPAVYGFNTTLNSTGVREDLAVRETFELMKQYVPRATRVAVLADLSVDGDAVIERIRREADLPMTVVAYRRAGTLAEWRAAVQELQSKADLLCIASYQAVLVDPEMPETVDQAALLGETSRLNKLPDFSFRADAVGPRGVMAAVAVPIEAQAEIAANMAIEVVYRHVDISRIRMVSCSARRVHVDRSRAGKLDLIIP